MKSIEERAALNLIYEKDFCGNSLSDNMVCRAYVRGAEEQKAIDEAEVLKLKSSWEKQAQINHDDKANYQQGYHDAIEKACKACKNELRRLKILLDESVGVPANLISVGKSLSKIRMEMEESL